jgi:hypothetical protein
MPAQSDLSTWNNGAHMLDAQPRVLCAACNNEWMNNLELVATPVVASMIRRDSMSVGTEILRSIAEWALAAAIVRAEMTNQMKSVDADLAAHFRRKGLDDLPVGVGLYRIERPVGSPVAQKIASSLIHDADNGNVPGHMIAFWLDTVGIVVNTEGFVGRGERSLRLFAVRQSELGRNPRSWIGRRGPPLTRGPFWMGTGLRQAACRLWSSTMLGTRTFLQPSR